MHTLRHRFATRGTRNLRAVQTLVGHASIATTERYTAVDDDEIRAAAASHGDDRYRGVSVADVQSATNCRPPSRCGLRDTPCQRCGDARLSL
ncbi:tyrosine-type recombinase/integrase [Mycobacterium marseillense]|uniref:tyrosine-type recombinase/integrase n=1 Tax=Mycobacterium marseillense TaxID=701042 RepID=UPI001F503E20|nr:tyrosine-type recombinase/integrase [Mycobacterium marseillense]